MLDDFNVLVVKAMHAEFDIFTCSLKGQGDGLFRLRLIEALRLCPKLRTHERGVGEEEARKGGPANAEPEKRNEIERRKGSSGRTM